MGDKPKIINQPRAVSFWYSKPDDMTDECWENLKNKLKNFNGVIVTEDADFEIIEPKQLPPIDDK